jgi:putative DNA primase/helicase
MTDESRPFGRPSNTSRLHGNTLLRAALTYGRGGLPVFPCRPDKRPYTLHGFHDASCDERQIIAWWQRWPQALIGMPVPKGHVVVDVDSLDGFTQLATRGMDLPDTLTAATPRGQHLWYHTTRDIAPATAIVPGVDLRGPGSYVIVPPSPGYRWLEIRTVAHGLD